MNMQIVLDTSAATWTATYYASRPTDPLVMISTGALPLLAQNIGAIGFARTTNSTGSLSGKITNFDLSVDPVPEPASSMLLVLGMTAFGLVVRRKS